MATVHAEAKAELLRQYQEIVTKYLTNISETVDVKAHFELKNEPGFNYFLNNEDQKYPDINKRLAAVILKYPEYLTLAVFNADFQDESVTDHYEKTLVDLANTLD